MKALGANEWSDLVGQVRDAVLGFFFSRSFNCRCVADALYCALWHFSEHPGDLSSLIVVSSSRQQARKISIDKSQDFLIETHLLKGNVGLNLAIRPLVLDFESPEARYHLIQEFAKSLSADYETATQNGVAN